MSPIRPPTCPHCGSKKLSFAEQLTSVTVYQCAECGRAVSVPRKPADSAT
jgi:DNA-directed RNA polymerase subunit RPC12/RpoP